ncbi:MAG: FMN-binding protein [Actinomycetaceae bacterium]|nr:FMN-binding protein [Actinomycetaceae bacterium]
MNRAAARRRAQIAGIGLTGALLLSACSPPQLIDTSIPMQDGQYTGQSNPDEQGAVGTVTITVENGRITSTSYETIAADGHVKDEDYGKTSTGEIGNSAYYERAQAAVRSYEQYSQQLVDKQDPMSVDIISGATVAHSQFLQAAVRAVLAAQGVEDDGSADSINMPSLDLDESDY